MSQFEAGKTYPLRGGGQGEIFVTKDGKHWGRMVQKAHADWAYAVPTCWEESTGKWRPGGSDQGNDLIAPPTTVTEWVALFAGHINTIWASEAAAKHYLGSMGVNNKLVPIHITTHPDGRVEIKGGTDDS